MKPLSALAFAFACACAPGAALAETALAESPALPLRPELGPADLLAFYRVPAERFAVRLAPERRHQHFAVREVSFPSPVRERWATVHGAYYRPVGLAPGQRVPAAVVVHHLGGRFDAEKYLAQHLAQHGVAAFFLSLPNYGRRREPGTRQGFLRFAPELALATFRQAALDAIRAGDFLRSRPEVDPERVGLVGVSLGAFVGALARGVDPRLGRTALVLGGGDLAGVLEGRPEGVDLLERSGLPLDELRRLLRSVDPVSFGARVEPGDVLMINARNDEIVPERSARALWRALGRPRIHWLRCGHKGVVLHLLWLMNEVLDHLRVPDAPSARRPPGPE